MPKRTYNTGYSLVVTDPTTNPALPGLSRGERTGSRVFLEVWSYVSSSVPQVIIKGVVLPHVSCWRNTKYPKHLAHRNYLGRQISTKYPKHFIKCKLGTRYRINLGTYGRRLALLQRPGLQKRRSGVGSSKHDRSSLDDRRQGSCRRRGSS